MVRFGPVFGVPQRIFRRKARPVCHRIDTKLPPAVLVQPLHAHDVLWGFDPFLFPQFPNLSRKIFHVPVTLHRVLQLADSGAQQPNSL